MYFVRLAAILSPYLKRGQLCRNPGVEVHQAIMIAIYAGLSGGDQQLSLREHHVVQRVRKTHTLRYAKASLISLPVSLDQPDIPEGGFANMVVFPPVYGRGRHYESYPGGNHFDELGAFGSSGRYRHSLWESGLSFLRVADNPLGTRPRCRIAC